ncbi:hypothetical protein EW146_g3988 [Bondarzewia mesenterica]|uniref:tRNA N(3)-methylcytidine methyltransferase n=1 Tax=Bondarzewia mesenterica TaxID=1095465 RepID=A0A4S4LW27_9AGAM|nr:hypothetical protein EW146_g3988 [Bondarzewia mesenterica]
MSTDRLRKKACFVALVQYPACSRPPVTPHQGCDCEIIGIYNAERFLTEDADVWSQNAWDHVPPPDDQEQAIALSLARQRIAPVSESDKPKYNEKPAKHWDNFYKMNASNFFKDRKWLHLEFPELVAAAQSSAGPKTVVEIGCGAGNSVFPLLSENTNPELIIHAYDFASHAVKLVQVGSSIVHGRLFTDPLVPQNNPLYTTPPCGAIKASVWDLSSEFLPEDIQPGSADIVVLVFVLSALHPQEWGRAISNVHKILKPGGLILFRDYGRHDLTQLRFKSGRLLDDNFYIRGDKTRVYFFELALLFSGSRAPAQQTHTTTEEIIDDADVSSDPLSTVIDSPSTLHTPSSSSPAPESPRTPPLPLAAASPSASSSAPAAVHSSLLHMPLPHCPEHPLFSIVQLGVDRRLIVNRKRQLKMYRVWMQGKYKKL